MRIDVRNSVKRISMSSQLYFLQANLLNPAVSKMYLLKRMTLELSEIQTLRKMSISIDLPASSRLKSCLFYVRDVDSRVNTT
jgi:hypothetical protein